jgi:hypothetical protein
MWGLDWGLAKIILQQHFEKLQLFGPYFGVPATAPAHPANLRWPNGAPNGNPK